MKSGFFNESEAEASRLLIWKGSSLVTCEGEPILNVAEVSKSRLALEELA